MSGSDGQLMDPASDPKNPANYVPSQTVDAVSSIIKQVTGGNAGSNVAGANAAQTADNGFFGDIAKSIQTVTTQLGAAFQTGVATGGSPANIAAAADDLAKKKAAAIITSGQAGSNVVAQDALQKAAAATQTAKDAVTLGLDPNNPDAVAGMKAVAANAAEVFKQSNALASMRSNGFFDNPGKFLMDRVINIPIAESRAEDALTSTKQASEAITAQTQALGARSVVDNALNSVDTVNRAAELYKQSLSAATAAGIEPLTQALQLKIGAGELGVGLQNAATARGNLAISQAKLPGELLQQTNVANYYGVAHDSMIEQLKAKADLEHQNLLDKVKKGISDATDLKAINATIQSFGGQGNVTDLGKLNTKQFSPLSMITSNLQNFGSVADSPAHAYELLNQSRIPLNGMPASHLATLSNIDQLYNEGIVATRSAGPNNTPLPSADTAEFVNSYVSQKIRNESMNIQSGNKFMSLPSVNTLVERPWAQNNPILTAMRPMAVDGNAQPIRRDVDGSLLVNTAASLVKDGKLTDTQAASALKDIATNLTTDLSYAGGWKRFAVPTPDQFTVMFKKAGMGLGSNNMPVNLFNSADTLTKLRAQIGGMKSMDIGDPSSPANQSLRMIQ